MANSRIALAASFDNADEVSKGLIEAKSASNEASFDWVVVADEAGAKMDAAVRAGLEVIFADYESRGFSNVRNIYNDLNN